MDEILLNNVEKALEICMSEVFNCEECPYQKYQTEGKVPCGTQLGRDTMQVLSALKNELQLLESRVAFHYKGVLPPCNIGDKVYRLDKRSKSINEAVVVAIYLTEDKKYYSKSHAILQYDLLRGRMRVNFSEFGRTVFLTREEAEANLKEGSN